MRRLNYQHLLYFWTVVRRGSLARACEELRLSPPTVSTQLRQAEQRLGARLLERAGRRLVPTESGRLVFRFAEEIFALGRELLDTLDRRPTGRPLRLVAGVDDVLPKEIVRQLIEPALEFGAPVQLVCREAGIERLLADLAVHAVDVVLSDAPMTPSLGVRAYNHHLGTCGVVWMGTPALAAARGRGFPRLMAGAPVLLPTIDTELRRNLERWFEQLEARPRIVGEFEDYALLREFGRAGRGFFPAPSVLVGQLHRGGGLSVVGTAEGVRTSFYAISVERRIKHPAVVAICEHARRELFA
ncbi:MAG: transcriptional activator NhaR [Gammaproteobacteria bacterium]|nr:transcriptional activator NhaR [Gammaproteobacteria bacterium]